MAILAAENLFLKGLVALAEGDPGQATSLFLAAIDTERRRGFARPQPRYLSYYGLSLAFLKGPVREAASACETAACSEPNNADLQFNLAKVYRIAGHTGAALAALQRGIDIDPKHRACRHELAKIDRRSQPPISGLHRSHPLNRWLGRMRSVAALLAPRHQHRSAPVSTTF